jgi:haloalkane dehalogenase
MHYLDEGPREAPPVLMLHGNPTWSFYYRNLVKALSDSHRCIVPDHIGCGLSDKPGDEQYDYRLARRIEDVDSLINHLDLAGPLTLVVHDWGGMIGFAWAVQNPQRIAKLVILNTAAFPLPEDKRMPPALSLVRDSRIGQFLVLRFNAFSGIAARVARIATARFVQDIPLSENDPGFDILLQTAEHLHLLEDKPCLIAWGEKDFVFDKTFLKRWLDYYPDARINRYPDCGHYILEDGGPALIDTIKKFIEIREDSNHGHRSG